MPPIFEGAKLSITKILSSHFQVSHSMTLNNGSNSAYKFGANYVGTQLYTQSEVQKKKKKIFFVYIHFIDISSYFG
jgi:hypothetical protein